MGFYAALMAKEGFTATLKHSSIRMVFFELFNGAGNYHVENIFRNWGKSARRAGAGRGLKQYPCCASTHSAIDAAIVLRERHQLTPDRIAENRNGHAWACHWHIPTALIRIPRSMPNSACNNCVARALMHGAVTFDHFSDSALKNPQLRALLA
jgi:2-methylcitrate dehydratase PrpD